MANGRSNLDGLVIVRFQGRSASGTQAEMTCHARTDDASPNDGAGLIGLATEMGTWFGDTATRALFFNGVGLDQVTVQDLSPTNLASVIAAVGVAGTRGAGAPAATQDCLVVTKETGLAGVQFRGRMYTWGALASDLDAAGGLWDSTFASDWQDAVQAMLDAMPTASPQPYTPVLWHENGYGDPVGNVDTVTPITAAFGRTGLAVQKGRRS